MSPEFMEVKRSIRSLAQHSDEVVDAVGEVPVALRIEALAHLGEARQQLDHRPTHRRVAVVLEAQHELERLVNVPRHKLFRVPKQFADGKQRAVNLVSLVAFAPLPRT